MAERFVRYRDQADIYDGAAVTVRGTLTNVQPERDWIRNEFAATREVTAQAVSDESAARLRGAEVVASRDNARTELAQVPNCLTPFGEWISSDMPELLNSFDSIVGQRGQGSGTRPTNSRLSITR